MYVTFDSIKQINKNIFVAKNAI